MNLDINYFTSDKSGKYCREEYLKKYLPNIYNKIILHKCNDIPISFKDRIYLFATNQNDIPKCKTCKKQLTIKNSLKKGFSNYCSVKCMNQNSERKNNIKQTYLEKYGKESHNQLESTKNKKKESYLRKYGVDNPMKNVIIKNKIKNVLLKKYGVDNPMNIPHVIEQHNYNKECMLEGNIKRMLDRIANKYKILTHNKSLIEIYCPDCQKNFFINSNLLNARLNFKNNICTECYPVKEYFSIKEKEILNFIKNELNIDNVIEKDRKILNGKELDIYLPDYNLAIEFNGLYFHSDKFKPDNYHLNKTNLCNEKDIQLIHIFEDEWMYKQQIVKSMIQNKLNLNTNKIFARKCAVKEISDNKLIKEFLNNNHIQGFVGSKIKLGLFYENKLVSLMTFGKKRKSMNNKSKEGEYELLRFCNKLDTSIIGGASKLFKHFIKTYNPNEIISYANRRYSNGKLYKQLGMDYLGKGKPSYYYFEKGRFERKYRFGFRKDILVKEGFDKNKSERQIMRDRGYLRIYDCGILKYVYKK